MNYVLYLEFCHSITVHLIRWAHATSCTIFSTSQSCTFNLKQLITLTHKKNHQINIIITIFRKLIFRHSLRIKDNAHVHNIQNFQKMYNTLFASQHGCVLLANNIPMQSSCPRVNQSISEYKLVHMYLVFLFKLGMHSS